jgi:hypothetical protein
VGAVDVTNEQRDRDNFETYRARFRFRVLTKLRIEKKEHRIKVGERDVVLSPQLPSDRICDSDWLIMNARGFSSETEARVFAHKLRAAANLSSVACRYGIDSGIELPTSGLGQTVKDHLKDADGIIVRDNVHGVDVCLDDQNVRYVSLNIKASVLQGPEPFLGDLCVFFDVADCASQKARDVILLLNYALMNPDPVAKIVIGFSAVEMLGQQESWSDTQRTLLNELAENAEHATIGTPVERKEVSRAIRRGTHKLGLREGVLRLLESLGLAHLKKDWDELYGQRSTLVHGLAPKPGADYGELSHKSISLCGHILLKVVTSEIASADKHVDRFYKI